MTKLADHISETAANAGEAAIDHVDPMLIGTPRADVPILLTYMVAGSIVAITAHLNERLDKIEKMLSER